MSSPSPSNNRSGGATHGRFIPLGRIVIIVEAAIALAFLGYLLYNEDVRLPFGSDRYKIEAAFSDAGGLSARSNPPVTVAGVPLGKVTKVRYENGRAVATLELDGSTRGRIHRDATATIAPRSALNDLTVDIDPGTAAAGVLRPGARVAAARTIGTVGFDRITEILDADTRAQLQVLLGELSTSLHGRTGELAVALRRLAPVVDSGGEVAAALAQRRRLLTRVVGELDRVFGALGARGGQLREAVRAGDQTLAVTAARERDLSAMVGELPGTLGRVRDALGAVQRLARPLEPALQRLRPFARSLPAALASLRAFVPSARALVGQLDRAGRDGAAPAAQLRIALDALAPAATGLRPAVAKLLPVLRAVDRNKEGIGKLGDNFSGVFSTNDANGPILRGLGFFEPFNAANFGFPGATGTRLAAIKLDVVRALTRVCLRENELACLVRYLVPGLPGAVRSAARPLGDAKLTLTRTLRKLRP